MMMFFSSDIDILQEYVSFPVIKNTQLLFQNSIRKYFFAEINVYIVSPTGFIQLPALSFFITKRNSFLWDVRWGEKKNMC